MSGSAIRHIVRDTFAQARSSGANWLCLSVTGLFVLFCLSLGFNGPRTLRPADEIELISAEEQPVSSGSPLSGTLSIGFGAFQLPLFRDVSSQVHFIQALFAVWCAGAMGTLFALVWTAWLLPEFLRRDTISVILAKPISRPAMLYSRVVGIIIFITMHAVIFVGLTWAALGIRSGVWSANYLWTIPILVVQFALFFAFSVLLSVATRSGVASAFGTLAFWLLCFAMNIGRHASATTIGGSANHRSWTSGFTTMRDAAYWILPKPADMALMLDRVMQTSLHIPMLPELKRVEALGQFSPILSLASSTCFAVVVLSIAAHEFKALDY